MQNSSAAGQSAPGTYWDIRPRSQRDVVESVNLIHPSSATYSVIAGGDAKLGASASQRSGAAKQRQTRHARVFSADALSNPARMAALAAAQDSQNEVETGSARHMRVVQAKHALPLPPLMVTSQRGEAKATTVRLPKVKPKAPRKSVTFVRGTLRPLHDTGILKPNIIHRDTKIQRWRALHSSWPMSAPMAC